MRPSTTTYEKMPTIRITPAVISAMLNEPVRATMIPVIVGAKNPATLVEKVHDAADLPGAAVRR